MALKISPLQMTDASNWSGITSATHFHKLYMESPQKASKLMTRIHNTNFGLDLDSYLDRFEPLVLDKDTDFTWDLIGTTRRNVPLVEARLTQSGNAVSAGDRPGLGASRFYMVFPERWFTDVHIIVGHKNEQYQLQVKSDPIAEGTNWLYEVELLTGSAQAFVPIEELEAGTRWSRDWSAVEMHLSKKGGGINFTSPLTMRNAFTMIRMQHTTPGNMISRPFGAMWKHPNDPKKVFKTWLDYQDFEFDRQYREEKNRMLMFARMNRGKNGQYLNRGKSGGVIQQGAGIRQQMESANTTFYNKFSIEKLEKILVDLSVNKLGKDQRNFVLMTGEWGMRAFSKAVEEKANSWRPLFDQKRMYSTSAQGVNMAFGFGGQFVEYMFTNNIKVSVIASSLYDDQERNKIKHPDGGVAESHRFDILDVGTVDGEPNIRKVYVKGQEDIWGYEPGLRDPYSPSGAKAKIMANSVDGYTNHRACVMAAMVKDPTKTASLIPSMLQ